MPIKPDLLAYSVEVALHTKLIAYRILTVPQAHRLALVRQFIDQFCYRRAAEHATDEDALKVLDDIRAGWPIEGYFKDPASSDEQRPICIKLAVYTAISVHYHGRLLAPTPGNDTPAAMSQRLRLYLHNFSLIHDWHRPSEPTNAEVVYFYEQLVDASAWFIKNKDAKLKDLGQRLGLSGVNA